MKFKNYLFVIPKRFLSVALASTLVFGSVSTIASAIQESEQEIVQQAESWDGSVDTQWYYQHKEKRNYSIKNAKELAGLACLVNEGKEDFKGKKITLTASIDFSKSEHLWEPIGSGVVKNRTTYLLIEESSRTFKGTFNGNKKTINGIKTDDKKEFSGLFGANQGFIKNVIMVNSNINGKNFVGGVSGYNSGSISESCNINGIITAANNVEREDACAGGVAGINKGDIYKSYNTGTVRSIGVYSDTGGVVGYNNSGKIANIYNDGPVSGGGHYNDVGGAIGRSSSRSPIENIYNTGSVSSKGDCGCVGGVIGSNSSTISNSYNKGSVSSSCKIRNIAGGVFGDNSGKIQNIYNTGEVRSDGGSQSNHAGGVTGSNILRDKREELVNVYYNKDSLIYGTEICEEGDGKTTAEMQNLQFAETLGTSFIKLQNKKINQGYPILKFRLESLYWGMIDRYKKELNIKKEKVNIDYDRYKNIIKGKIDIDYAKKKLPSQDLKNSTNDKNDKIEMEDQLLKIINEFDKGLDQNKKIDEELVKIEAQLGDRDKQTKEILLKINELNRKDLDELIEEINSINEEYNIILRVKDQQFENQWCLFDNLQKQLIGFEAAVSTIKEEYTKRFTEGLSRK